MPFQTVLLISARAMIIDDLLSQADPPIFHMYLQTIVQTIVPMRDAQGPESDRRMDHAGLG